MALDLDREIARHNAGWAGFCKFLTISTVAIAIVLLIMAATLL